MPLGSSRSVAFSGPSATVGTGAGVVGGGVDGTGVGVGVGKGVLVGGTGVIVGGTGQARTFRGTLADVNRFVADSTGRATQLSLAFLIPA